MLSILYAFHAEYAIYMLKFLWSEAKLLRIPYSPCIQDWLSKFGYLPSADPVTGQLQTKEALTKAIKAMQRFGGLEETGVFGGYLLATSHIPHISQFVEL